jgi:uncharacterized protein
MTTPPAEAPEPSPDSPLFPGRAEHKLFRSPSLAFGFVRVCLYLIISFLLFRVSRPLLGFGLSPYSPKNLISDEALGLIGALLAALALSRLEKRPFGDYGLPPGKAFGRLFWLGAAFGLLEISAVVGAMSAFGSYHFGALAIHGADLARWAFLWAFFFCLVGLYEEFTFRGYLQFTLAQGMGFWPTAILLSLAFGAVHIGNKGETWIGIASVILTGLLWCFTLKRTGNLWFAVGMHASFDFGETFLYSVPDSGYLFPGHLSQAVISGPTWLTGGSAGPEASLFDFLVLFLFFYLFHGLYPPRRQ